MPRITIDEDLCVGTGDCARIAPQAFEVTTDADMAVVLADAASTPLELLQKAAYNCPTGAISIEQD